MSDPRIGKLFTPKIFPRDHGQHGLLGYHGNLLGITPQGTNGIICPEVFVLYIESLGRVIVDAASSWVPVEKVHVEARKQAHEADRRPRTASNGQGR